MNNRGKIYIDIFTTIFRIYSVYISISIHNIKTSFDEFCPVGCHVTNTSPKILRLGNDKIEQSETPPQPPFNQKPIIIYIGIKEY